MQIQLGQQGMYQIRPTQPANRSAPTNPATQAAQPNAAPSINRAQDSIELSSPQSLNGSAISSPGELNQYHTRMQQIVAGETNQPVSFDPPAVPRSAAGLVSQAYFKQAADYASLNAAAVDRAHESRPTLDVRI